MGVALGMIAAWCCVCPACVLRVSCVCHACVMRAMRVA